MARKYDFMVDGICYNKNSDGTTVSVTFHDYAYDEDRYYNQSYTLPSILVIPSSVTYNGKTYSVTSIGDRAFSGCISLTSIEMPSSVTSIVRFAFSGCTGLTSVTIPSSVTSIDGFAFSGCISLTSIEIPNSMTRIGYSAFSGCSGLISVTIGDSVTSISSSAFDKCNGLTSINVGSGNPNYTSIDGVLYNKDVTKLILCPYRKTRVTIPTSVTSIACPRHTKIIREGSILDKITRFFTKWHRS